MRYIPARIFARELGVDASLVEGLIKSRKIKGKIEADRRNPEKIIYLAEHSELPRFRILMKGVGK
jgi:hypothetical protein